MRCGMPLASTCSVRRARGAFLLLVLLYKVGDAFALSLYSAFMIKGVGFSLARIEHRRQGQHDGVHHHRRGARRLGLHALGHVPFAAGFRHRSVAHQSCCTCGWRCPARNSGCWCLPPRWTPGIGGMGQAAFVAFLVSLCSPNFSATQYALLSALASFRGSSRARLPAHGRRRGRVGEFLRRHLPQCGAGTHLAGDFAPAPERTRGARSARNARSAQLEALAGGLSGAANDRSEWTRDCARCPRTRGPSLRPRHRRRPTSPPAHRRHR